MLIRRLLAAALLLALPYAARAQLAFSPVANASSTGTTVGTLAKIINSSGTPTAVQLATTDTIWAGLVVGETGASATTGNAILAIHGPATCAYDGATTTGDFVTISSTTAGDCHDTGAATYPTSGAVVGIATQTLGSAGNASTYLIPPGGIAPTGVTAGSYTSSNITVGADGRVTAAANGSGGGAPLSPGYVVEQYYNEWGTAGANTEGANFVICQPFHIFPVAGGTTVTIDTLSIYVGTADASNTLQAAIYNSGSWGYPSTLIEATGNISLATATAVSAGTLSANATLSPGTYWECTNTQSGTATYSKVGAGATGLLAGIIPGTALQELDTGPGGSSIYATAGQTYGTWNSFTSSTAWGQTNGVAIAFHVHSVP